MEEKSINNGDIECGITAPYFWVKVPKEMGRGRAAMCLANIMSVDKDTSRQAVNDFVEEGYQYAMQMIALGIDNVVKKDDVLSLKMESAEVSEEDNVEIVMDEESMVVKQGTPPSWKNRIILLGLFMCTIERLHGEIKMPEMS